MSRVAVLLLLAACGRISFDETQDAGAPDAGGTTRTQVIAGGLSSCALTTSGDVYCWGWATSGHLGDGSTTDRALPGRVALPAPAAGLELNDGGACALIADGRAYCWGANNRGLLGLGHGSLVLAPELTTPSDIVDVSIAYHVGCIRHASGGIGCAGGFDLIGTPQSDDQARFVDIADLDDVVHLTGGDAHTCAVRANGAVTCWGRNSEGQHGNGSMNQFGSPAAGPPGPYVQISAGDDHTCARRASGTIDCWGLNTSGQLGDGTLTDRTLPVTVQGIDDAIDIAAGAFTTCALHAGGTVSCWGSNANGILGDGTIGAPRPVPGPVAIADVVDIAARTSLHICAVTRDDDVYCWGDNAFGQIGDPSLDGDGIGGTAPLPTRVIGLPD